MALKITKNHKITNDNISLSHPGGMEG